MDAEHADLLRQRLDARRPRLCARFVNGEWQAPALATLAQEMRFTLYVNELELVSMLCTPHKLDYLALGFLYSEGIIAGMSDVVSLRVCVDDALVDVRLWKPFDMPQSRTLTSGCGAGVSFDLDSGNLEPVDEPGQFAPEQIAAMMRAVDESRPDGRSRQGTHYSALSDGQSLLVAAEDVGRHNTLDKIAGECLAKGIDTAGRVLLSTGRISWEMLTKAARMRVALVVSRNSPTDRVAARANALDIGVVGYARGGGFTVYASPQRVVGCPTLTAGE